jgi:ABC-2 type transport system permease protein
MTRSVDAGRVPLGLDRFRGFSAFLETETRVQLHEGPSLVSAFVIQVIFLVFVALLDRSYLVYTLVGAIVFSIFTVGERVLNEAAYIRLDHKLNELYHASPLTPESYFLGMSGGVLLAYLPPVVLLLVLLQVLFPLSVTGAAMLTATCLAAWLFSSALGYSFSTLFRDMRAIWPYSSLLFNLFGVLPPVFYPLFRFPTPLQPVALALPPSAASALSLWAMGYEPLRTGAIALAAVSLTGETIAVLLFALWWARRSAREG